MRHEIHGDGGDRAAPDADPVHAPAAPGDGPAAPHEEALDRLTRVAAQVLDAPMALVALIDAGRLLTSRVGLPEPLAPDGDGALGQSICTRVIAAGVPLVLDDAREHPDVRNDLEVRDHGVVAVAGLPLDGAEGPCPGALCVMDRGPRNWTEADLRLLADLAALVSAEMRLRRASGGTRPVEGEAAGRRRDAAVLDAIGDGLVVVDGDGTLVDVNERLLEMTGFAREELVGTSFPYPFTAPGIDIPAFDEMRRRVRETGEGSVLMPVRRRDGGEFRAEVAVRHLADLGGRPAEVVTVRDAIDRLCLEERLEAGEALHRSLLDAMAEGVVVHAPDGAVLATNAAAEQILGLTADQMRGRHPTDARWRAVREDGSPFPGEELPAAVALRTGEPVRAVIMGVHKPGGALTWIRVSAEPVAALGAGDGRPVVATLTDVTSLRHAEEDLRRSEEVFRRLSDQAPVGIFVTDAAGACTWVSATWSEMTGMALEEARGDGWGRAIHPDDADRVLARRAEAARAGQPFSDEFRFVKPDGQMSWVTSRATPMHDSSGAAAGYVGVVADSTGDRFFDMSPELLAIVDADGRFVRMNRALQDLLGATRAEASAVRLADVLHPDDREEGLDAVARADAVPGDEVRVRARDGSWRRVSWSVARDPASGHLHVVARDVTEQRLAEETEAALLRVSSVLAAGRSPQALFQAVAREVGRLLETDVVVVARFDGAQAVAVGAVGPLVRIGMRFAADVGVLGTVHRTAAPASCVLAEHADDPTFAALMAAGQGSAIGVPVVVRGAPWGAIVTSASPRTTLDAAAIDRLSRFSHMVEAAISTAEARREIVEYAAEQSALRRVATLVAQGGDPAGVFELVAEEAASLLAVDACGVLRVEPGGAEGRVLSWWAMPGMPALPSGTLMPFRGGALGDVHLDALPPLTELAGWFLADAPDVHLEHRLAAPVVVNGLLWGAVLIGTAERQLETRAPERLERFAELVGLAIASADARAQLAEMASTDHLTGLRNRRAFDEHIELEVARARRQGRALSLIVLDLDHFKGVNDAHGHQVGDRVLAELADRLRRVSRAGEVVARVGGEEFAWLLPETDGAAALAAAERARGAIAAERFPIVGHLTSSAGVCELVNAGTASELFRLADLALYWAKAQGRDASFLYTPAALEVIHAEEQTRRIDRARALAAIQVLAQAVDSRDSSTVRHSERVAALAERLALTAGWTPERARMLHEAALVHDVGKVGVPDSVLFKPGLLDDDERDMVRQHVGLGTLMVGGSLAGEQVSWIRGHHERFDGGGYPDGLAADRIPEGARLLAVADAWDAMTVARTHTTPLAVEDALAECRREGGRQFCPSAVAALEALWQADPEALMPPPPPPEADGVAGPP